MRKRQVIAQMMRYSGGNHLLDMYWGAERLTVLAYHRIADFTAPDFQGFIPNISANPALFEEQIAYCVKNFNVIDLATLRAFVREGKALPERALLITFDDGYMDNYKVAFPILKKYACPAVIFLVTSRMDNPLPLWWDISAEAFKQTQLKQANLPLIGEKHFSTAEERHNIGYEFIESCKSLAEADKQGAAESLLESLAVQLELEEVFMSWEEVNELVANNIMCQPHTVSHPIMTRISVEEMRRQLQESRQSILEHTTQDVYAFAYPNGMPGDYNLETIQALRDLDYDLAFTLSAGPLSNDLVKQYPYQIRRVFLSYRDTFEIFLLKLYGVPALQEHKPYLKG